jgi:hypothetical protein
MSATQASPSRQVEVHVTYGLGGRCSARFARAEIEGVPARALIGNVVQQPQRRGLAARTAAVLAEVLRARGDFDVEVLDPARRDDEGIPVALDEPLLRTRSDGREGAARGLPDEDEIAIRVSESYRGGA